MADPLPPTVVTAVDNLTTHLRAGLRGVQGASDIGLTTLTFDIFAGDDNTDATVRVHGVYSQTGDANIADDIEDVLKKSLPQFSTIRSLTINRDYKVGAQESTTNVSADYLVTGGE